jgi:hypothetical protein
MSIIDRDIENSTAVSRHPCDPSIGIAEIEWADWLDANIEEAADMHVSYMEEGNALDVGDALCGFARVDLDKIIVGLRMGDRDYARMAANLLSHHGKDAAMHGRSIRAMREKRMAQL